MRNKAHLRSQGASDSMQITNTQIVTPPLKQGKHKLLCRKITKRYEKNKRLRGKMASDTAVGKQKWDGGMRFDMESRLYSGTICKSLLRES